MKHYLLIAGILSTATFFYACTGRTIEANNALIDANQLISTNTVMTEEIPWIVIASDEKILYKGNTIDEQMLSKYLRDTLTHLALNRELPKHIPIVYQEGVDDEKEKQIQNIVAEATQVARSMVGLQLSNRLK